MKSTLLPPRAVIALAPEGTHADNTSTEVFRVAEIITYRLNQGVRPEAYLQAARATVPFLNSTGAVVSRNLSRDADGLWTEHVVWTSQDAARAAEAEAMQRPEFAAFFAMVNESTMVMRFAPILLQMD